MSLHNISNLPTITNHFKSFADVEEHFSKLRRGIINWTATLPEHVNIVTLGLTALADPNDDRIVFWDDSAGNLAFLDIGTSLSLSATTLDAIQDIRATAGPSFDHLHLTVAIGTAPLSITSTTMSPNLNADLLDGYHASAFLGLPALTDPDDDRIVFWDDSEGALKWLDLGNSLATTLAVLDTIQDIRTTAGPTFDHIHLPATAAGATPGIYDGTLTLVRSFQPTGSDGHNLFVGSAGNSTMSPGGGATSLASYNVGVGDDAIHSITTGKQNFGLGLEALYHVTTGQRNTAVGTGSSITMVDGSYNTAIGVDSLYSNISGNSNVAIGHSAGFYETGSNKLFIDNVTRASEADGRLKALLYGIFDAATANQYLYINGNISTPLPITSTLAGGTAPFVIASNTMSTNLNADLLDGSHAVAFEQALGNPAVTGYVLSSTDAGVRSWIAAAAGGGAPTDAQYVCLAVDGDLSAERVLTGTANQISITDNGANGTVVLSTPQNIHTAADPTFNTLTASTYLYAGVNDTTRGMVYAYGHGAASVYGGTFVAYTSADHDTTIGNYGFMVYEDDLYIGPDTNVDALKLDANDDLYVTGGSLILPASEYVNFGGTLGAGGYGLRDNAGAVEYCDSGGAWTALNSLGGGGGAPTDATYIVQTANGSLSAEQVLGALATGLLWNTTTTGVLSILAAGAHIADTTGGDIVDTEARATIALVLAALETAKILAVA